MDNTYDEHLDDNEHNENEENEENEDKEVNELNNYENINTENNYNQNSYIDIYGRKCTNFINTKIKSLYIHDEEEEEVSIILIVISIIFSISFYIILISAIITKREKDLIVYTIIFYLFAFIFNMSIFLRNPKDFSFLAYSSFKEYLAKIINAKFWIVLDSGNENDELIHYGNFIYDITGEINIPNHIKYVKFDSVKVLLKECDYNNFKDIADKFKYINKHGEFYFNRKVILTNDIFILSFWNYQIIKNIIKTILSILLLQWINAIIFLNCQKSKKEVLIINFFKLLSLSDDLPLNPTKIIVHDKKLDIQNKIITIQENKGNLLKEKINSLYQEVLDREKEEKEEREKEEKRIRKKKEKERKKREEEEKIREEKELEIKNNTTLLSKLENNHFEIKVYKIYDDVKLQIFFVSRYRDIDKILGKYDPNAEEEIINMEGNSCIIFYPNGFNIKIEIHFYEYNYTIQIGNDFNTYKYKKD